MCTDLDSCQFQPLINEILQYHLMIFDVLFNYVQLCVISFGIAQDDARKIEKRMTHIINKVKVSLAMTRTK